MQITQSPRQMKWSLGVVRKPHGVPALILCVVTISCSGGSDTESSAPRISATGGTESLAKWPTGRVRNLTAKILYEPPGSPYASFFQIRQDEIARVIKAFQPAIPFGKAEGPVVGPELKLGLVRLEYDNGRQDEITIYGYGKNTLIFSINGRLYHRCVFGDTNLKAEHLEIYGINEEHVDESFAIIELLEREKKGE